VLTVLLLILLLLAFGGFGHTGYRRGWCGGYNGPATGSWNGGLLGLGLLVVVLLLLFTSSLFVPVTPGIR